MASRNTRKRKHAASFRRWSIRPARWAIFIRRSSTATHAIWSEPRCRFPPSDVHLVPAVGAPTADVVREPAGRGRLGAFAPADCYRDAEPLALYRLSTLTIIRHADRGAARIFLSDLRELERNPPPPPGDASRNAAVDALRARGKDTR